MEQVKSNLRNQFKVEDIRSMKGFIDYIEHHWGETSCSIVQQHLAPEEVWNKIFVLIKQGKLGDYAKIRACGDVVMEIEHSLGILILINKDYEYG